jgi:type II restriction/modification system DNA methylase subunit YeeA
LVPFDHVERYVKPVREKVKRESRRKRWWIFGETMPAMRKALAPLDRFIATPQTSKHRVFVWLNPSVLIDGGVYAIARDDDYTFGVLHSKLHEVWSLALGTSLEDRPRYTPSTCFETFAFPCPTDAQRADIEKWAKYLDTVRVQLLKADSTRTLTKLYNDLTELRETRDTKSPVYPLLLAHEKLDAAVAAAYGWQWPMTNDEVLAALLALNLERAPAQS